ncbi:MAG TPA: ABC transporter substrate-binding protein [Chloroflexota bacterium]|nr:ABC transporter substrate-binding protein [Chloroflexota bacterium]
MVRDEYELVEDVLNGVMSRRQLITRLMAAGVALPTIVGILTETGLGGEAEAAQLAAPALAPKRGGTLKIGYLVPAADVDPVTMFNEGAILTAQLSMEYLCYPRPDYSLAKKLAVSWHAPKPDTWIFNLRKGVKWHNGKPFTADDVVYTFNLLTDPATNSAALSAFKGILSKGHTRKIDAHTVQFHLDRGYSGFPYLVSALTYNSAILPKGYKVGQFIKGGIGTGPFILTGYTPKVGATYKKNPHYWAKGLPYLNGVHIKYYGADQATVLGLQAGEVDIFPNATYQGGQALFSDSNLRILRNPGSAYREFHMRVDKSPFTDKRVRQAVAYSLDRPALVKSLLNGLGQVGNDHGFAPVFGPLSAGAKKVPQRKQDIAKAKQLLAAAGHPNGIDVTLTFENYLEIPQYAVIIKEQCKAAGINVTLNGEDQNTYYGSGDNQPWLLVPMGIVDWAPRGTPSQLITPAYLSSSIPPPFSGWNSAHWSNKTFDRLIANSDKEINKTKYNADVYQAAKIMNDEVPAVIAYWINDLHALKKTVHGVPNGPGPYPDFSATWIG